MIKQKIEQKKVLTKLRIYPQTLQRISVILKDKILRKIKFLDLLKFESFCYYVYKIISQLQAPILKNFKSCTVNGIIKINCKI